MDSLTTLYYGMDSADGFLSMPVICDTGDIYAVVKFKSQNGIGSFPAYKDARGYKSLEEAKKAAQTRKLAYFAIYKLQEERPRCSTRVNLA